MNKRILVAPLNWGLGHATRCIPIIEALIQQQFTPVLASDGYALELLRKEFPGLDSFELPSYHIRYAKNKHLFKLKLLQRAPKLLNAIKAEKKIVKQLIETENIHGIVSDNRLGVYYKLVPCVFITHQLQVLSGTTTWISTKLHLKAMKQFNECWVPDYQGTPNLSGKLGHMDTNQIPIKYIGPISRFVKKECPIKYEVMVLLSGPEPQRTLLEKKLLNMFKLFSGSVLFIKGVVEKHQKKEQINNMTVYNFMTSDLLETALNQSQLIISRSGYTTIMDLTKLGKQAFFIPTPGQFEQEYLAERLDRQGLTPYCNQEDFSLKELERVIDYKGLNDFGYELNYKKLFGLFKTE
ncbi:MAG: glycosyltransferase [Xanthomarina gelatinilytica]|uniref:glycosyltransferase n=1 Tax=Xanthomarina gelatinilytica TaxID=1137281 RepID=UPI003A84F78C